MLKLGEHLDGTLHLDTALFGGLKPGAYRIEANLSGWTQEQFTDAEPSELARLAHPFLRGEIPASVRMRLTHDESIYLLMDCKSRPARQTSPPHDLP